MLKRILSAVAQFVAFCACFYVGGYWDWIRYSLEIRALEHGMTPPPMVPLWKMNISPTLDYKLNGLVFALCLLVLILLYQAVRRRLGRRTLWTLGVFVLAFGLSLLLHSGFVPLTPGS